MTPSELTGRLFNALVKEICERWPEYIHSRFTIAEIYQNLVPWRTHRETMGIATSREYEQALLCLLAGEGDYLALESKAARDEIQAELECRSPNTAIYRDFAAVGVRLNPSRLPLPDGGTERQRATQPDDISANGFGAGERAPEKEAGATFESMAAEVGAGRDDTQSEVRACAGCSQELPQVEGMHYCPFCGQDIRVIVCLSCGMRIESAWSYCVGCGARAQRD